MRLTFLVPSLALLVLSACADGGGVDTDPDYTTGEGGSGSGGSSSEAGKGGSTAAGTGGTGGAGKSGAAGTAGTSGGSAGTGDIPVGGSAGATSVGGGAGDAGTGGATAGTAGVSGSSGQSGAAGAAGSTAGSGGSPAGGSGGSAGTGGKAGSGGSAGSSGSAGSGGSAGSSGSAGAPVDCDDKGPEPNDSEILASPACQPAPCQLTDSDSTGSVGYDGSLAALTGVVSPDDTDFYKFHGNDKVGFQVVDPAIRTFDGGVRICMYIACETETKDFKCTASGTTKVNSPNGLQGCCLDVPGEVTAEYDCAGSATDNDSADVYIEVSALDEVCSPYSVDFHF